MASKEIASELAKSESKVTGEGPVTGGAAATAQSVADKQDNLAAKIDEVTSKPADEITQKDASELQSRQDRVLGSEGRTPGGLLSEVQQQADKNAARKE
ncbi:hypothetical protein N3K66_007898 [Trichothecium roseum]|uniref:Uncharacterized protein n=1 Tax=Trichothecium roseum TaxID=47278 RepID=A0ACC0URY0_9HYPO|nr:hypothetical protein N3K66_007898 [Trichothecium roseum]